MLCNSSAVTTTTTTTDGRLGVHRLHQCRGKTLTPRGGKSPRTCPSSPCMSSSCRPMLDSSGGAAGSCCCCSGASSRPATATAAQKVTKKYRVAAVKRREYLKLKAIVPAVSTCRTVSKLTVIEEAIKYIDILHATLATRIGFNGTSSDFCGDQQEPRLRNPDVDPDEFIRQLCFGSFHAARSITSSVAATGSDGAAISAAGHPRPASQRQQQQQRQQSWRSQATTSSRPPLAERQRAADGRSLVLPTVAAAAAVAETRTQSPTPAII